MKLYVVQNSSGKFFRARGQHGWKDQWQDKLEDAKFYTKLSTAKTQCTVWYNINPKLGCPCILEFNIKEADATIINMSDHAVAAAEKKAKREAAEADARRAYELTQNLEDAKRVISVLTPTQRKTLGL